MTGKAEPSLPDLRKSAAGLALAFWLGCAAAQAGAVHGRLELQDAGAFARSNSIDAALGAQNRNDLLGNFRFTWEPSWERFSLSLHYVLTLQNGDSVRLARIEAGLLPNPPVTWFNLTETFENHAQVMGTQTLDRVSLTYSAPHFVLRIGRQALTWGSGLVFRPMDLFDPFSPSATDSEFKTGTDMLYAQWLFTGGSDLQLIVVPRPKVKGAQPSSDASSVALHLHAALLGHQTTWLLARDHGDWVAGVGVNGTLSESTWNVEIVPTLVHAGPLHVSALANISTAVTLANRNATIFAEYFHNGFGVGEDKFNLAALPPELITRLARGQLFNTRRDYVASGLTLELTPLLSVGPTVIADLNDASLFALFSANYSVTDNLTFVAGAQLPIGPANTEFGGVPINPESAETLAPPAQIYLQLRQYF